MSRGGKSLSLLDSDGSDSEDGSEGKGQELLNVNEGYARRFEHNKRREELHRLKEKHPEAAARLEARGLADGGGDDEDETSTSEDESGDDLIHPKESEDIFRTLVKIKNKDPSIYKPDTQFYSHISSDEEEEGGGSRRAKPKRSKKKNTLRGITAKRALEEGAEALAASSSDEDEPVVTYSQEQEQARRAFTDAANAHSDSDSSDDDSDSSDGEKRAKKNKKEKKGGLGGFSSKGRRAGAGDSDSDSGSSDEGRKKKQKGATQELLDEYFGKEREMKAGDKEFLKNYIMNDGWAHKDGEEISAYGSSAMDAEADGGDGNDYGNDYGGDWEDECHLDAAEQFETNYNFRFEEPNSARIETFPRTIESSVRKTESKRKRQRESKKERVLQRKQEEALEVKRLKNLKKAEIRDKMEKIKKVAGLQDDPGIDLSAFDLDADYDPDAFDKQLGKLFDDGYYNEKDEGVSLEGTGDKSVDAMLEEGGDIVDGASKQLMPTESEVGKRKSDLSKSVSDVRDSLNEYFKLDYEDKIGDVKCRFSYSNVKAKTYGMDTAFILGSDDKDLNQIVSIKRLSTYKTKGGNKEDQGNPNMTSMYYNAGEKKRRKRAERRARKRANKAN